ncbi:Peptidoglycan/LPS O-acetylase OafA/YrhL, contains acyltransferase and SGNH-hydrolase domains [Pedococcus cremeus]|uniref:Peptidoglycan/LPS O-acetylase OafA/YrhL, contains acyltransferase and SGNH-hydrolase domains n=1 Tax=Pedococcus cremeus TaxID=587636 RepID=A0A1H9XBZ1_9MICO|nr:Peptidoglycan/LPS O-acetylase OafA/YrhL, contains acyltransferase and SGNH-hydrolase domains [Pedococcus cremeus]
MEEDSRESFRPPHLNRSPALDGMRGLAALAVVLTHFADYWGALPWCPLGGMGVLVFFVLSGYLIARVTVRQGHSWAVYRAFVRRRAVRLGPAIVTMSVVVPLLLWLDGMPRQRALGEAFRTATQTTGLSSLFGWEVHPALQPPWSLTTEWLFYLAFPLAVLVARRRGAGTDALGRIMLCAAAGFYICALPLNHEQFYSVPLSNVGVMCVGAALAFAHESDWAGPALITSGPGPYAGLAMVLIFVLLPGYGASWGYAVAVLPATALAAAVMIHGVHHRHPVLRVLALRPLVTVGVRSYSLYLWHVPVMWFVWRAVGGHGLIPMFLLGVPLIALVTTISFICLERPALPARQ